MSIISCVFRILLYNQLTMKSRISVVIAAYNEAPRIAGVLRAVTSSPIINEVIVVDDGSSDNTTEIVSKYAVKLIKNEKNVGKTLSVKKGINAAKNDLIMLLDADLVGLDAKSLERLARPVLDGQVDWTLSLRGNSFRSMRLLKMDWLSGERVVPKRLLMDPMIWSKPKVGYGLEALMNKSLLDKKCTFKTVYLKNVINTRKADKNGPIQGFLNECAMHYHFSRIMPLYRFYAQFLTMAYLNRKYSKV